MQDQNKRISRPKEEAIIKALVRHSKPTTRPQTEAFGISRAIEAASGGRTTGESIEYGIQAMDCWQWLDELGQ